MRNRGMEAMVDEMMHQPIPELLHEAAQSLGLPKSVTMAEFTDHMRVHANVADPGQIKDYLAEIAHWDLELETEDEIRQGDRIGSVRVNGKKTPVFAHMGITFMFDRTDPPLEKLFASIQKSRKKAIVLHVMPHFFIDADAQGAIRGLLLQGGWHLEDNIWSPFLLTTAGPDDIPAQRRFIKPGPPSRGLLRERSLNFDALKVMQAFQRSINNLAREAVEEGKAPLPQEEKLQIATGSQDWSFFGSDEVRALHGQLMDSLATPKPAPRDQTPPTDIDDLAALAPQGLADAVRQLSPDEEGVDYLLSHLAILTNGFEGLDDGICENLGIEDIGSLIRCSTAGILPGELAWWMHEVFGWEIAGVNAPEEEDDDDDPIRGHGDVLIAIEVEGQEKPVPVMFHGGWIDPLNATENFSFLASRMAAQVRFEGAPCIIMPASIYMRTKPGEKPLWEGGGMDSLAVLIGYAFDGQEWYPISLGKPGSNPLENRLEGSDPAPANDSGYTGKVTLEVDNGATREEPPLAAAMMMQVMIDRHHDLGPEVFRPRDINPQETYEIEAVGESWGFFQDQRQVDIYPETKE